MTKPVTVILLLLLCYSPFCQTSGPLVIEEYKRGLNPIDEISLFNQQEIKTRKVHTVYIIYHPASWAEYDSVINPCTCSYSDTLCRYDFDREGRIIAYTNYYHTTNDYYTMHYDTSGHFIGRTKVRRFGLRLDSTTTMFEPFDSAHYKEVRLKRREGTDTINTTIQFWKFKHGLDTAIVEMKRFDKSGKLIEEQSTVNKKNAREVNDDTDESSYHYRYNYDNQGRLVYYEELGTNEYRKISYPPYGKQTDYYNSMTNQLTHTELKLIKEEDGLITITFDRRQITLTPLEKGSKLFKLTTIVEPGEIPLLYYHEFIYKSAKKQ